MTTFAFKNAPKFLISLYMQLFWKKHLDFVMDVNI